MDASKPAPLLLPATVRQTPRVAGAGMPSWRAALLGAAALAACLLSSRPARPQASGVGGQDSPVEAPPFLVGGASPDREPQPSGAHLLTTEGAAAKERARRGEPGSTTKRPVTANVAQEETLPAAPAFGGSFPAVSDTGVIPPDPAMAAGPNNLVVVVNGLIDVFSKGGTLQDSKSLIGFFSPLGQPASDGPFDPKVVYDEYIGRFWVLATSRHGSPLRSALLIGLSNTSDATEGWMVFALDATLNGSTSSGLFCDFPQLGIDAQALYLTCNMFSPSSGQFSYAKLRILTKDQFVNRDCCRWWDFFDLREGPLRDTSASIQPAHMHDAAAADGEFLIDAHGGGAGGDALEVWQVTNPQTCCIAGNQSAPGLQQASQSVAAFSVPPDARQAGAATSIDTSDSRLLYAFWAGGRLATGQNLACPSGACIGFTEIDVSGFPSTATLNDWYLFAPSGVDHYYPAVDESRAGKRTMVYSRSGVSDFAGSSFIGIPPAASCVSCVDGPATTLQPGLNTYVRLDTLDRNRWGDYLSAAADPDGTAIWVHGEFAASPANTWGTAVGVTYGVHPPNDELADVQDVVPGSPAFTEDTHLATTTAASDPTHGCTGGQDSNTVWFRYVPAASGAATVTTFGSDYDTVLTAYDASLTELACNDDFTGHGTQSQITLPVAAGATYYIEVSDFGLPGGGSLVLNLSAGPPATTTTTGPGTTTTSTSSTSTTTGLSSSSTTTTSATTSTSSTSTTTSFSSSSTSSTTTTLGSPCGNGRLDPGEQCDDGNQLDNDCCSSRCTAARRGTPCGSGASGECDGADSCDSNGHCLENHALEGTPCSDDGLVCTADVCDGTGTCTHPPGNAGAECRAKGTNGACDAGDACDGQNPDCPVDGTEGGCFAQVPDTVPGKTISVTCEAQADTVQGGTSRCTATGFLAATQAAGTASAPAETAVAASDCTDTQVTVTVRTTLKKSAANPFRQRRLKLKLNAWGRRLLRQSRSRSLKVCVQVTIKHGSVSTTKRYVVEIVR